MSRPDARVLLALMLSVLSLLAGQPGARTVVAGEALDQSGEWEALRSAEVTRASDGASVVSAAPTGKAARSGRLVSFDANRAADDWRLQLTLTRLSPRNIANNPLGDRVTTAYMSNGKTIGYASTVRVPAWRQDIDIDVLLQLPPGTDALLVSFVTPSVGAWRLSPLSVVPVQLAPWHAGVVASLLIGWGVLIAWLLIPGLRRPTGWMMASAVFSGVAILVIGTGFSRSALSVLTGPLAGVLDQFLDGSISSLNYLVQKGGHFLVFALLALILARYRSVLRLGLASMLCLCIALAIGSEAMQLYIDGRAPRLTDFVIDMSGVIVGLLLFIAVRTWHRRVSGSPATVGGDARG